MLLLLLLERFAYSHCALEARIAGRRTKDQTERWAACVRTPSSACRMRYQTIRDLLSSSMETARCLAIRTARSLLALGPAHDSGYLMYGYEYRTSIHLFLSLEHTLFALFVISRSTNDFC